MGLRKCFVWLSLCTALLTFGVFSYLSKTRSVSIPLEGQPRMGNPSAPLTFVIFEDFLCRSCRNFNETIFPKLKTLYIDQGVASYVMVPVALTEETEPVANAALAVFAIAPNRGFEYAEALFTRSPKGGWVEEVLLALAEEIGGIDTSLLEQAIEGKQFYGQLDHNYELAKTALKGKVSTPALFINGHRSSTQSFEAIRKQVEKIQ